MNIRQLQALHFVVTHKTATAAAEAMGVSQPAISGLIAAFEKNIGIKLFTRNKGRLLPTPEALRLAEDAEKVIASYKQMEQKAKSMRELKTGELRIASLPGPALETLPRLLAQFLSDKPDVQLHLQIRPSIDIPSWVATHYFDMGIAELPLDDSAVDAKTFTMKCVCIVPDDHPLAEKSLITPLDLDGLPFIALEPGHVIASRLATIFNNAGAKLNIRANVQLFSPACIMVAEGMGVSIVDPFSALRHEDYGIKMIPFEPVVPFSVALITPRGKTPSLLVKSLFSYLERGFKPYLSDVER